MLAKRTIELAKGGAYNPDRLCEEVIKILGKWGASISNRALRYINDQGRAQIINQ
jgi:hypothetical protein